MIKVLFFKVKADRENAYSMILSEKKKQAIKTDDKMQSQF